MPVQTDYASVADVKARLHITDAQDDALLASVITAASRAIDAYCGRGFGVDAEPSIRLYWPTGNALYIHDAVDVSQIESDELVAADNWRVTPSNALATGRPITGVILHTGGWGSTSRDGVSVTARWGWPSIPSAVKEATLLQAARLYKRKDSPLGVLGTEGEGAIRLGSLDPDLNMLLMSLRRYPIG